MNELASSVRAFKNLLGVGKKNFGPFNLDEQMEVSNYSWDDRQKKKLGFSTVQQVSALIEVILLLKILELDTASHSKHD